MRPRNKEFFDGMADEWDIVSVHDMDKVESIADILRISPGHRILDVGTGTGVMIPAYEKRLKDGEVLAIDYSENMLKMARNKYPQDDHPGVRFILSDVYEYSDSEGFDIIVCYSCFPHFQDKPLAISHLSSLLRSGGTLAVAHSSSRSHINSVHMEAGEAVRHDRLPAAEEVSEMMEVSGLSTVYTRDDEEFFIVLGRKTE